MLTAVLSFALLALVFVMATLGSVLMARFVFGGQDRARRVFAAALGGPLSVILPTFALVSAAEGMIEPEQLVGFGFILVVGFGVIGWPVAHFATRRLDRLTQFDPQVFE